MTWYWIIWITFISIFAYPMPNMEGRDTIWFRRFLTLTVLWLLLQIMVNTSGK